MIIDVAISLAPSLIGFLASKKKTQFPPRHSKCRANFIWKLRWLSRREEPSRIWRALRKEVRWDHPKNRTCRQRISLTSVPFQAFQVGTYIIYIYTCWSSHSHRKCQVPSIISLLLLGHINWHCLMFTFHTFNSQMLLASLLWIPLVLASSPAPPVHQKLAAFPPCGFPGKNPGNSRG